MKRKIWCIGCSFTAGITKNEYTGWTDALAELLPKFDIYNIAVSGSSIQFHSHMLHKVLAVKSENDIIISQQTTKGRITSYTDFDLYDRIYQNKDNHYEFNPYYSEEHIKKITTGNLSKNIVGLEKERKLAHEYYSFFKDDTAFNWDFHMHYSYLKKYSDFLFFHRKPFREDYNNTEASFFGEIGDKQAKRLSCDNGGHLTINGCHVQGKWVLSHLIKQGIINERTVS